MKVHFLHIRKTGGSAVRAALGPIAAQAQITIWGHDRVISEVPVGEKIVFCVRDPVSRFVSGFNTRLRKGRPLNNTEWYPEERTAFETFSTPNSLAEAISAPIDVERAKAHRAMESIYHVKHRLSDWVESVEQLKSRAGDILMVLSQPDLTADFERLKSRLNLPSEVRLPTDEVRSHRTPPGFETRLSEVARRNLERWYAADLLLYRACMDLRSQLIHA